MTVGGRRARVSSWRTAEMRPLATEGPRLGDHGMEGGCKGIRVGKCGIWGMTDCKGAEVTKVGGSGTLGPRVDSGGDRVGGRGALGC